MKVLQIGYPMQPRGASDDVRHLSREVDPEPGLKALSSRQIAIGRLMATGVKDVAIARELGLSLRTIRSEISALIAGLGARSRFQAGYLMVRHFG
jgi:DNA-binding NarL/FixJ family response regulator